MDINEFRRVLTSFADEPSDVDIRLGKVVAQVRDDVIDANITYANGDTQQILVEENGVTVPAHTWLFTRIARLPQLADRIIAAMAPSAAAEAKSPFVTPSGRLTPDLSEADDGQEGRAVADAVDSLLNKATSPLPGATSVLYITSDAGEGKTTVIGRAAVAQAQRYKQKTVNSLIVPIPLSGRSFLTFDDAVIAALVNKLRFNYLYFDAFNELVRLGAIVPAFDGYEEMLVEGTRGEAISALGNLVQGLNSSGTIFVAARKAFFDYLSFRTQARLLDAIGDRSASFSRLEISRWNRDQFCQYGTKRLAVNPNGLYETVSARLGSDHPLLTRAVLVRRLFDVALEQSTQAELVELLGSNPHDYFFTFVDAIVKREANEKWLSRISGDVAEPLLTIAEHHELLAQIAQEMWQASTNSLRFDILDVIVDIFSESKKKGAGAVRQIKERLKQHSLLVSDSSRGQALAFDHEDFQNFYLGEALGQMLASGQLSDLRTFLSVNIFSTATVEQAVQSLMRAKKTLETAVNNLAEINRSEAGFSFCKENCSALVIRLIEFNTEEEGHFDIDSMVFSTDALVGKRLRNTSFVDCHFQPTSTQKSQFNDLRFENCIFERLEIERPNLIFAGCSFKDCRIESLVRHPEEDQSFDPQQISSWIVRAGGNIEGVVMEPESGSTMTVDDELKAVERFLRIFLRTTQVDEAVIRLRLGNAAAPSFLSSVLPALIQHKVLEEVPWKGRGIQKRYKLIAHMSDVSDALETANGSFNRFLAAFS